MNLNRGKHIHFFFWLYDLNHFYRIRDVRSVKEISRLWMRGSFFLPNVYTCVHSVSPEWSRVKEKFYLCKVSVFFRTKTNPLTSFTFSLSAPIKMCPGHAHTIRGPVTNLVQIVFAYHLERRPASPLTLLPKPLTYIKLPLFILTYTSDPYRSNWTCATPLVGVRGKDSTVWCPLSRYSYWDGPVERPCSKSPKASVSSRGPQGTCVWGPRHSTEDYRRCGPTTTNGPLYVAKDLKRSERGSVKNTQRFSNLPTQVKVMDVNCLNKCKIKNFT